MIVDKVYKISAFGSFSDINPSPENMIFLLDNFKEYGLIPSLVSEINIVASVDGSQAPVQKQIQRLALLTSDNSEQIMIGSNRIDYTVTATSDVNFSTDDIEKLNKKINNAFTIIFHQFNKKASRVALNTESLIINLSKEEIENFTSKFANPLTMYQKDLDEWNTHLMVRAEKEIEQSETLNVITNIAKVIYEQQNTDEKVFSEGFVVSLDINTIAENASQRFSPENIEKFTKIASELWNDIITELE